ncbi:MAG: IS5/IS1182 family transposase, partial [Cytophagaceae bacterium]|nr:IS5/IS1182 family transposase [Cytophagaceae bacterium]
RIKRFRRVCTRYEKLDVMYLAFLNLVLIYDELKLC